MPVGWTLERAGCRPVYLGLIVGLVVGWAGWLAAPTAGAAVPLDALGAVGDEEIVFPSYSSADRLTPDANAAGVGDVNGDGREDVAMVLPSFEPAYPSTAWISFSPADLPTTLSAGEAPWEGMQVTGTLRDGVVAGVGDVNGDGLGEVVLMTPFRYVVVFGRTDGVPVDVDDLGNAGFSIDNVSTGVQSGGGSESFGVAFINHSVTSAGDQSGDGRPDLAFRNGKDIQVAYTPADPAGAHIDASNLGDQGFTLAAPQHYWMGPFVSTLGDINGDSRPDLAAFWQDADAGEAHATGVITPSGGSTVDLTTVAEEGRGFDLFAPDTKLEEGLTLGDQDGDGHRDIGLATTGWSEYRNAELTVAYSPEIGVQREVRPTAPAHGVDVDSNFWAIDVGDQDGDGRDDIGDGYCVKFSSGNFGRSGFGCGITSTDHGVLVVGSVGDRNGDDKAELLVVYANPFSTEAGNYQATWRQQVYLSVPAPTPELVLPPSDTGDELLFTGRFLTNPGGGTRTVAGRGSVVLRGINSKPRAAPGPGVLDANSISTRVRVVVNPARVDLVPGQPYQYRMSLQNSRGLAGLSAPRWFVFRGPSRLHPVNGTAAPNKLRGTPSPDIVQAFAGNDVINVRDGIRDYISCGPGRDRVGADARDRVYACEDVFRSG